uniref:C-type lectin domain-containing protein n=1 Tax=Parascaris equorum TaxID=6256 RepID=A0A914SAC1_PAREQ
IPGTTTQGQARLFCTSLTDTAGNIPCNLGWPESMADLNMINSNDCLNRIMTIFCSDHSSEQFSALQYVELYIFFSARATLARTYWIGITRSAGAWVTPAAVPAVPGVLNWRRGQPDGCCGRNVSCVIAGYRGLPGGMWDDTSCETIPRGLDGYLCRTR